MFIVPESQRPIVLSSVDTKNLLTGSEEMFEQRWLEIALHYLDTLGETLGGVEQLAYEVDRM